MTLATESGCTDSRYERSNIEYRSCSAATSSLCSRLSRSGEKSEITRRRIKVVSSARRSTASVLTKRMWSSNNPSPVSARSSCSSFMADVSSESTGSRKCCFSASNVITDRKINSSMLPPLSKCICSTCV